jgi:hypothetical protein
MGGASTLFHAVRLTPPSLRPPRLSEAAEAGEAKVFGPEHLIPTGGDRAFAPPLSLRPFIFDRDASGGQSGADFPERGQKHESANA